MNLHFLVKILCSLPVILLFLYFIPFIGVCLIILRGVFYSYERSFNNEKHFSLSSMFITIGLVLFIPNIMDQILKYITVENTSFLFLHDFVSSTMYGKLFSYGQLLFCLGILSFIISYIFKHFSVKLSYYLKSYILNQEKKMMDVSKTNDMEMKLKQERATHTHVVFCPSCGADNILTEKVGKCKYCRTYLEYKDSY